MFSSLLTLEDVPAKTRVLQEGTEVTRFYIVCEGIFHVRRMAQKREILMGRLGPGAFFGEINLFDPGVATASIYSMKVGRLASISYDAFRQFMEENTEAGYKIVSKMMAEMARRLRQTDSRLVNSIYWSSADPSSEGASS